MDNKIEYLNTDLDVWSPIDLTSLAAHFATSGLRSLHVTELNDGTWYATFEVDESYDEPEQTVAAMLNAIDALPSKQRDIWMNCSRREFNIGYDCGEEPWGFNQSLSHGLLNRLAVAGGSIRITLYPDRRKGE